MSKPNSGKGNGKDVSSVANPSSRAPVYYPKQPPTAANVASISYPPSFPYYCDRAFSPAYAWAHPPLYHQFHPHLHTNQSDQSLPNNVITTIAKQYPQKRSALGSTNGNGSPRFKSKRVASPFLSEEECKYKYGIPIVPGISKVNDGRERFQLDGLALTCQTLSQAIASMTELYGGFQGNTKILDSSCNKKAKDCGYQVYVRIFQCTCLCNFTNEKCLLRVQIREYKEAKPDGSSLFYVFKHKWHNKHTHSYEREAADESVVRGLDPKLKVVLERVIDQQLSNDVGIQEILPSLTLNKIINVVKKDNLLDAIREKLGKKEYRNHVAKQIRTHLYKRKEIHLRQQIGGFDPHLSTNDILIRVLDRWKLVLPQDWSPRGNFSSAHSLARALQMTDNQMIIVNLTLGKLYERFKRVAIRQIPSVISNFVQHMEQAFFVTSPTGLFHTLCLTNRREGTRAVAADASGGFCTDHSSLIPITTPAVYFINDSNPEVKSSPRIHSYLHVGGERYYPVVLAIYHMRKLSIDLFGRPLEIDWGISDHSDAFIKAHRFFKTYPKLLDDDFHPPMALPCMSIEQVSEPEPIMSSDPQAINTSVILEEDIPVVTQSQEAPAFTQPDAVGHAALPAEQTNQSIHYADDFVNHESGHCSSDKPSVETAMNSYFHVMQHFSKPYSSFVARFKNKDHVNTEEGGLVYHMVKAIQLCKTTEQRHTVSQLVLRHWREEWEEHDAADIFEKEYLTYPYWNWNYAVSGEVGVVPTNCPLESLNKRLKTNVQLNIALPRMLCETLPSLLNEDANLRCNPCDIEYPLIPSVRAVLASGFLEFNNDIIALGEDDDNEIQGYLCNLRYKIGTPIMSDTLALIKAALTGNSEPFSGTDFEDNSPWAIAGRLVNQTKYVCQIKRNAEGVWVGDCEDCYKRLGRNCPGVSYVRSFNGQLATTLEEIRKVAPNDQGQASKERRKGNHTQSYKSGKLSRPPRSIKPMLTDFRSYLKMTNRKQRLDIIRHLCLLPWQGSKEEQDVFLNGHSDNKLLKILYQFAEDAPSYRDGMYSGSAST